MADILNTIKIRIRNIFGDDSLDWFDISYVIDWIVVIGLFLISYLFRSLPVFERDFSPHDPLIQHPYASAERIPSFTNNVIAIGVPVVLVIFIGGYRSSVHEIHHGLLATLSGSTLSHLITYAMKNRVGKS